MIYIILAFLIFFGFKTGFWTGIIVSAISLGFVIYKAIPTIYAFLGNSAYGKDDEEKADYLLEQALLQLRVNLLDECIATCNDIFALKEDMADAYKICGIAYGEKKNKTKMQQMLEKAKSLGAENTDELLEKYK